MRRFLPIPTSAGCASPLAAAREIDAEWEAEDADAGAVLLPARYEIRYRTHAIDLTQTG